MRSQRTRPERQTRKTALQLRVPVLPDEEQAIKASAKATGLSVAAYLLKVGLGYQVTGILDHQQVQELARINGDLGRMGGLLKLWLTDDGKIEGFDNPHQLRTRISALLSEIGSTQRQMQDVMQKVVR